MSIIEETMLQKLHQEDFGPGYMTEALGHFPEIFEYLKHRQDDMGQARPIVTFATAATIWAFKSSQEPLRELPGSMLYHLWQKLARGSGGDRLCAFLEHKEPHMWNYFVRLVEAAAYREDWDDSVVTVAALVYAPVLTACIYAFWPEQYLQGMEPGILD